MALNPLSAQATCILPQEAPLKQQLLGDAAPALQEQLLNQVLFLETRVNGHSVSEQLIQLELRNGFPIVQRQALEALGLPASQACLGDDDSVALDAWPDLSYRYDAAAQSINFLFDPTALLASVVQVRQSQMLEPKSSPGVLMNYQLFASDRLDQSSPSTASGLLELRGFLPRWGVLQHEQIVRYSSDGETDTLRLNTQWQWSDTQQMISGQLGDIINSGVAWARPVRLGGLRIGRDFSLQPNFITSPGAQVSGQAALPSSVEVYVNNVRQYETEVRPGPYEIQQLPVIDGAGQVSVRITDALGRETVERFSLYGSPQLLKQGLADFSVAAGYLRNDFATQSAQYDEHLSGSASLRYGLAQHWTVDAHTEAGADFWLIGHGQNMTLGGWGQLSVAAATSQHGRHGGHSWFAAYDYFASAFSLRAEWRAQSANFQDLAIYSGAARLRRQQIISFSFPLLGSSHVNFSYLQSTQDSNDELTAQQRQHSRSLTGSISQRLWSSASAYLSAQHDFENQDYFINLGFSWRFGQRRSLFSSYNRTRHSNNFNISSRKSLNLDGVDWGWDVNLSAGERRNYSGGLSYRSNQWQGEARVDSFDSNEQLSLSARGAVAYLGQRLLATNSVYDSFALVQTGLPNTPILRENRLVGETDQHGDLLVPRLSANQYNRLAIDPLRIPAGYRLPQTEQRVVPAAFSGVLVSFPIQREHSAVLILQLENDQAVPVGATLHLNGVRQAYPVGYDGVAYLNNLKPHNTVTAHWNGSSCQTQFAFAAAADNLPTLGPLQCIARSNP